jgi:hypothetical protein
MQDPIADRIAFDLAWYEKDVANETTAPLMMIHSTEGRPLDMHHYDLQLPIKQPA